MKIVEYRNKTIECYQDADFKDEKFIETCKQARQLWDRRADEYVAEHGHIGSAILGAGFTVRYLPPRGRKPQWKKILGSPEKYQGSSTWESSLDEIAQFFADNGIEVGYEWGRMG